MTQRMAVAATQPGAWDLRTFRDERPVVVSRPRRRHAVRPRPRSGYLPCSALIASTLFAAVARARAFRPWLSARSGLAPRDKRSAMKSALEAIDGEPSATT